MDEKNWFPSFSFASLVHTQRGPLNELSQNSGIGPTPKFTASPRLSKSLEFLYIHIFMFSIFFVL